MTTAQQHPKQDGSPGIFWWLFPGLVTFFLPLIVLAVVSYLLGLLLPEDWYNTVKLDLLSPWDEFKRFAYDVDGRLSFTIMSVAIWIAGPVAALLSGVVMYRALGYRATCILLPAAILVGVAIATFFSWNTSIKCNDTSLPTEATVRVKMTKGFRAVVLDNIMCAADLKQKHPEVLATTERMIDVNTFFGFGGAAAVMAALGSLAVKNDKKPVEVPLRRRLDDFRTLTLMGGVWFVLNALVTKALMTWTQGLLASPDDAASFGHLANVQLNFWAAQSSTVLFVTLACSAYFIYRQIEQAAPKATPGKQTKAETAAAHDDAKPSGDAALDEQAWKQKYGLSFDMTTVVTATIGTIAPFLAGPAADLVAKVLH